jgi:hypothetical protein
MSTENTTNPAENPPPQCPEALYNPDTGNLRRCVQGGRHEDHQTAGGTQWRIDLDTATEMPW